jgi:hypothetical protein
MLGGPEHPWRWPLIIIFWQGVYVAPNGSFLLNNTPFFMRL